MYYYFNKEKLFWVIFPLINNNNNKTLYSFLCIDRLIKKYMTLFLKKAKKSLN